MAISSAMLFLDELATFSSPSRSRATYQLFIDSKGAISSIDAIKVFVSSHLQPSQPCQHHLDDSMRAGYHLHLYLPVNTSKVTKMS
jgi:hypothetical protein